MHDFTLQFQHELHLNYNKLGHTNPILETKLCQFVLHLNCNKIGHVNTDSCSLDPSISYAVIKLAKRAGFFSFDSNGNPTVDFSCSRRACLVKTEEGSSVHELPYRLKQENVQSIINVNEPNLVFRPEWFSEMKYVAVLQLGRWESSAKYPNQVEDSEFLKGLKNMRQLRYLRT
ncbi:hypothetical protein L3X38_028499 [Prunus dulcis]|uniref:Uncharacterized protein n=1 Tax=Prunus dulcis TaxID=3755 RepID=A0AAD4VSM4_PRUDU|nr:hypothetical protein L3X38_028499 [Prunus dulcis]